MSLATQPSADPGVYVARRSQRVSSDLAASDGTAWEEKLAVCEGVNNSGEPQLLIRSFYRCLSTGEKLWDEPPSGAGSVIHASAEDRKKAEQQRTDLQLTLEMIPEDARLKEDASGETTKQEPPKKERKGLFGRFRRKKEKKQVDTAKDINLQRAIARSIAEQTYTGAVDPYSVPAGGADDDIELAKALSMSVMETGNHPTEQELFQRALEKSQRDENADSDGLGVASMPSFLGGSSSSIHVPEPNSFTEGKTPEDSDIFENNSQMDGKPSASAQFDPYSKS